MSTTISLVSAAIAILSLIFAIHSWLQANRPLVSAYISTASGGNTAIALNIVVENSGNRPAKDIKLIAKKSDILSALPTQSEIPIDAKRCFFSNISIPLLVHGREVSNAFGHLGQASGAWRAGAEIPVKSSTVIWEEGVSPVNFDCFCPIMLDLLKHFGMTQLINNDNKRSAIGQQAGLDLLRKLCQLQPVSVTLRI